MNFKEILLFLIVFAVLFNIFELLEIRWIAKKKAGGDIALFEKITGTVTLLIISVMFAYPLYYSFVKYQDVYGAGMAIIASSMVLVCVVALLNKVLLTLKALLSI